MKFLLFIFMTLMISCKDSKGTKHAGSGPDPGYVWTKLADTAPWSKSYSFQMMSVHDTLWTFHPEGNWYTLDGLKWKKSDLPNVINNHAFLDYVFFDGAVYGLGYFRGNIEQFEFKPEIYRTSDFKTWETIAKQSNLPPRFFYHPFVYRNKVWIIGGEDNKTVYADIWNSDDAVRWTKVRENLPFAQRSSSQIVSLNSKLYLLDNDVWISGNGMSWHREKDEIIPGEQIFGYKALVFDQKIWLIGCNRNGKFSSQVLYSSDGINWKTDEAPWLPRGGVAAAVHNNKIYMTGGKYGGTPDNQEFRYDNDIWVLEKR